jgi:beta-N-acetylhexosaminidase
MITRRRAVMFTITFLLPSAVMPGSALSQIERGESGPAVSPLQAYYADSGAVDALVEDVIERLSYRQMVAELVVTSCGAGGRPFDRVLNLVRDGQAGGVMFLGGTSGEIREYTRLLTETAQKGALLLPLFAIDGEPLLLHDRITDLSSIPGADRIDTPKQAREIAFYISSVLRGLGIHINYAPVCDLALNREVIGSRSFGVDVERVASQSVAFIETMQANGVVSTAKHFPGHGFVEGDSHVELLFVQGAPPEIPVFKRVIDEGVISIMIGHIGVQHGGVYDTGGSPSSLSRAMVTGVLKESLGFGGIVITDALNMGALSSFDEPALRALRAGCDMVLMPDDEEALIDRVRYEIGVDDVFREQIEDSVRKVVRLKLLLGLINDKELEKAALFDDKY